MPKKSKPADFRSARPGVIVARDNGKPLRVKAKEFDVLWLQSFGDERGGPFAVSRYEFDHSDYIILVDHS